MVKKISQNEFNEVTASEVAVIDFSATWCGPCKMLAPVLEEVSEEYLHYLYSDEAQRLAGENYYRPSNEKILKEFADQFDLDMNLVTIDDFGGWDQAFKDYFDDGAVFDQMYSE